MVVWNPEDEQMYVPVCGGLFSNDRQVRGERKHGLHFVLILSISCTFNHGLQESWIPAGNKIMNSMDWWL